MIGHGTAEDNGIAGLGIGTGNIDIFVENADPGGIDSVQGDPGGQSNNG